MLWLMLVHASGLVPLAIAWRANRGTTLRHALVWAVLAWAAWGWALVTGKHEAIYAALSLTGAAGVAVLGARRPGVVAWHFVVIGLLAVQWIVWVQGVASGRPFHLDTISLVFLIGLLGVTVVNYLPTGMWPGAVLVAASSGLHARRLLAGAQAPGEVEAVLSYVSLWAAPWAAGLFVGQRDRSAFDRQWLAFRDRLGLVWGQRLREQFSAAAKNADWPVRLGWGGLHSATPFADREQMYLDTLTALMKRFM